MSEQLQLRRGTNAALLTFTGQQGEPTVDTTNNRIVVHDQVTPGGWPAAKLAETVTNTYQSVTNTGYTVSATDRTVAYASISGPQTVTLCAASAFPTGTRLLVFDASGSCSATSTITLSRAGSDTINGSATWILSAAYSYAALESNGTNAWTVVDQPPTSVSTAIGSGMRNKLRNGTMDTWSRSSPITVSNSLQSGWTLNGQYTADGWVVTPAGASVTVTQVAGRLLTAYGLKITGASGVTDCQLIQPIESLISAALSSQTVTLQFWINNATGGSFTPTITVKHPTTQDNYAASVSDVSSQNLQLCAVGWSQCAYVWSASSSSALGMEIVIDFGGSLNGASKAVTITEFDVSVTPGAALGLSSSPPAAELRPIYAEGAFNQRYYINCGAYLQGHMSAGTVGAYMPVLFPQPMFANPTATGTTGVVLNSDQYGLAINAPAATTRFLNSLSAEIVPG